jgi:hypothetical protein
VEVSRSEKFGRRRRGRLAFLRFRRRNRRRCLKKIHSSDGYGDAKTPDGHGDGDGNGLPALTKRFLPENDSADKHRVGFPIRDTIKNSRALGSESGQAIVEYILVLVVTVAIVLGGVYQLNSAFKAWSKTYFGDYIACLLETGELPNIGGSPGDSTICQQVFSPFDPKGGSQSPALAGAGKAAGSGSAGGSRESGRGGGGGGGGGSSGGHFGSSSSSRSSADGAGGRRVASDSISTGDMGSSSGGGGYSATYRQQNAEKKERLDNRFAFDKESEDKQKRGSFSVSKTAGGDAEAKQKLTIKRKANLKDEHGPDDSPMTFGNFIRWLIIAAIIIALVVLVGGQMLQVGKSME